MKNRLQKLWDEVTPYSGPCPEPNVKKLQRRVDAALDGRPRAVPRRTLRLAVVAAAAVLMLTGTALAGGELIPPEFNVLSNNFSWTENSDTAITMMNITPVSVEDDNYTMTVTSSLADGNKLYFTLLVEAKNDEARHRLLETEVSDRLFFRIPGCNSNSTFHHFDVETDCLYIDVSATWWPAKSAGVRLALMDRDVWLNFPVKTVRSLTLKINAEAQGTGSFTAIGNSVTVDKVELSPLSYMLRYTASDLDIYPVTYFLFRDGSIRTASQLKVSGPTGGSDYGVFDQHPGRFKFSWKFGSVQDLSLMEAIVLGGTAYPLDGDDPYDVDTSAIPQPFVIPIGEPSPGGDWFVPLFALCDGLGADYQWDEAAGVAVATFRGTTLSFTVGSKMVQADPPWSWDISEEGAAPAYRDGELWVDGTVLLRIAWGIDLTAAVEDWRIPQTAEDGSVVFTSWVVDP